MADISWTYYYFVDGWLRRCFQYSSYSVYKDCFTSWFAHCARSSKYPNHIELCMFCYVWMSIYKCPFHSLLLSFWLHACLMIEKFLLEMYTNYIFCMVCLRRDYCWNYSFVSFIKIMIETILKLIWKTLDSFQCL